MLRRLCAVLALVLALGSTANAAAISDDVRNVCNAAADLCLTTCALNYTKEGFSGALSYDLCTDSCLDNWSDYTGLPHPEANGSSPGQTNIPDEGVFDPGRSIDESDLFGIGLVNSARVESACSKAPNALFSSSETLYGCLKKTCAGPGTTCLILCTDGKCFGGMPKKPARGLTLIGILQNGDNVHRGGAAEEPGGGGDSGRGASGGGDDEPECGIGGCGPIL